MERKKKLEAATKRFEMLAPLLSGDISAAEKRRWRTELMEKHNLSERTLRRYVAVYNEKGLAGLMPNERSDAGKTSAIPENVLNTAKELKFELPERSVKSIIKIMESEGVIEKGSVKLSTLSHNLLAQGYNTKMLRKEMGKQAAKRFVRKGRNSLWQTDFKHGPFILGEDGKQRRTYLAVFIDDATRLICHSQFYDNHRVPVLEDCLRKAIIKFGKPDSIFCDNGKEFVSRWMTVGCCQLGIRHLRAKPYSPQSRGKCEKFNGRVNEFIREVKLLKPQVNLSTLNKLYWAWLEESYQNEVHSSLNGKTPMEAYNSDMKRVTFPSVEQCNAAFLHEETRTVDKTGCFSLGGITFESDVLLIGKKVDIRFDPFDLSVVEVWYAGKKQLLAKPLVVGEYTKPKKTETEAKAEEPKSNKAATELGRSRLLEACTRDNNKRTKETKGVINFGVSKKEAAVQSDKPAKTPVGVINFNMQEGSKNG